jgi:threonine dehydratase
VFTIDEVRALRDRLGDRVRTTPVWQWLGYDIEQAVGPGTDVWLKLELFQYGGSFKPRGALAAMIELDHAALDRGVTAVSAGNHAIAVAYAASMLGTSAKVVMPIFANPMRVERCRAYGAEIVQVETMHDLFPRVAQIQAEEGRALIHPYEGPLTALGTATVALEFSEQAPELDAVVIPIGGGGLAAGMSAAFKQLQPHCTVYGVEPEGADTMFRSFAAGSPQGIERVQTIADSLGAPMALPYSYALCRQNVDEVVLVSDEQMRAAMRLIFVGMKLAVEPAGAAATAALCGPLLYRLRGKRVGIVICGSNIDSATFCRLVA